MVLVGPVSGASAGVRRDRRLSSGSGCSCSGAARAAPSVASGPSVTGVRQRRPVRRVASTVWWKVLRRNLRSGSSRSGGRNQGMPSPITIIQTSPGRSASSGWAWICVWWRWQSSARLSIVVGPPRDHHTTWCASHSDGGVVHPGQTQPRSVQPRRSAARRSRGGRWCPSPAPGPALSSTTRSMTASHAIRVSAPRSTRAPSVVCGTGTLGAGELLRGGDDHDPRDRPCRPLPGHRRGLVRRRAGWRRRGRGTRRRRRPSPRGRRRGADHGSADPARRRPRCRRRGRSPRRGPARPANFRPVHWSSCPLTSTIPVWSVTTDRCRRSRAFSSYRSPRSGVTTDSRCRARNSAAAGSNLRACSVSRRSTSSRRSRTTRPGNRFNVDRATSTCSRDTAPAASAPPSSRRVPVSGQVSFAFPTSAPTPASARPGTGP